MGVAKQELLELQINKPNRM